MLTGKKVLIIDDEQPMLDIVKSLLKRENAISFGVNTIEKGLEAVKSDFYDLVILDRHFPEGDGHVILQQMKNDPKTSHVPVVMLTAEKGGEEIRQSIQMGAAGYIVKPFTPKDFMGQLQKVLFARPKRQAV